MTTTNTVRRERDERGSIAVWMAVSALGLVMLVGLAVDFTGKVHAQQRTRDVAAQAARAGANEVLAPQVVEGQNPTVDIYAAKAAANQYLTAAGVRGTVTVENGATLIVTTTDIYDSTFLGIIGYDTMQVTGVGSARLIRTEGGTER